MKNYESGDRYVGQLVNGKKNGRGTYYFSNRDKYEGYWRDGKMHGQGQYFWTSGNRYEPSQVQKNFFLMRH